MLSIFFSWTYFNRAVDCNHFLRMCEFKFDMVAHVHHRNVYSTCARYIFLDCLLICNISIERFLLDVKCFIIWNICKTARCLYTAGAFQMKKSLTDILQTCVCYPSKLVCHCPVLFYLCFPLTIEMDPSFKH